MSEEDDDGIIRVDFGKSGTALGVKIENSSCEHRRIMVAEISRTVECRACGAVLDPLVVLLSYAKRERTFEATRTAHNALAKQVRDLKVEERRVKQRILRAKKKADPQQSLL